MKYTTLTCLTGLLLFTACEKNKDRSDASGTFEATETIVSAEVNGKVMAFTAEEGDQVKAGQVLGYIDSTQLYLQKLQLQQNRRAVLAGQPNVATQLEALEKELDHALSDRGRVANLVKGDVASKKQLDDADTRIAVLRARIAAQRNELGTRNTALYEQGRTIEVQLRSVEDQLGKCRIESPLDGTVLTTYVNPNEMTAAGRP
ncbi:MAG TPA: biotin/lipoyl-binding protein, partial [Flavobacteriales bacterium]|nr:biotin/lipoyl-binding protein [Flavobacteriales bacterium]